MKILVFLHGTIIMHRNGVGKNREERVKQSTQREESVLDYGSYIPIGDAVAKLRQWNEQGAEIIYMSSHKFITDVEKDKLVLQRYDFPKGKVFFRQNGDAYKNIAEKIMPDILVEDDCESIGGKIEMVYPNIKPELKNKIHSVIVKEFEGIDNLSDKINDL